MPLEIDVSQVPEVFLTPGSKSRYLGQFANVRFYGGQIPFRTLAICLIWALKSPDAGNLLASSGPFVDTRGVLLQ
jgi:hypothetical protein